jgi:H+/Cl- antiporter ClcA
LDTTSLRRLWVLSLAGAVLGIVGGFAAWLLVHLIGIITNVVLLHQWGTDLPSFRNFDPGPILIVEAMAGGLLVALLAKWAPVIKGHGIPEAMEAILQRQSRIMPRAAVAKPASAAIAIGTGGPFGAEGPIIVTGGSIGSLLGQVFPATPSERKILLASGAAAGMAATFGAPLASVILAVELLLFEFSARALVPLVVAASVAGGMHAWLFGTGPLLVVPPHDFAGLSTLGIFALLGLACGLLAVVIVKGLSLVEGGFARLPVSHFWHPVIGAFGFALVGLAVPRALGVGYDAINDVLASRIAVGTLIVLLLGKLLCWWIALGSNTSGGTLAPMLLIGGSFGAIIGEGVDRLFPGLHLSPGAMALVAMAAVFGAATRATFTAIVFAFELTHDYAAVLPLMVAVVLADLVASGLMRESIMTEKLARRGIHVPRSYRPDVMATTLVRDAMTASADCVDELTPVAELRERFAAGGHRAYPVVADGGVYLGMIDATAAAGGDPRDPAGKLADTRIAGVAPADVLLTVLTTMLDDGTDHVPVVEDDRVVGIVTRTDLLRARGRLREHEQVQPGWRGRSRSGGARLEG